MTDESSQADPKTAAIVERIREARDHRYAAMYEEQATIRAAHHAGFSIRKIAAGLERSERFVRRQLADESAA